MYSSLRFIDDCIFYPINGPSTVRTIPNIRVVTAVEVNSARTSNARVTSGVSGLSPSATSSLTRTTRSRARAGSIAHPNARWCTRTASSYFRADEGRGNEAARDARSTICAVFPRRLRAQDGRLYAAPRRAENKRVARNYSWRTFGRAAGA